MLEDYDSYSFGKILVDESGISRIYELDKVEVAGEDLLIFLKGTKYYFVRDSYFKGKVMKSKRDGVYLLEKTHGFTVWDGECAAKNGHLFRIWSVAGNGLHLKLEY